MPKPIRPSETQNWTRCPTKWYYEDVQGWIQPGAPWRPEMLLGSALHAGMAYWWELGPTAEAGRAVDIAHSFLAGGWPEASEGLEGMQALLGRMVQATVSWCADHILMGDPGLAPDILMVEQPLGADGHATPDLVTRERGHLVVTDYKTHLELDVKNLPYRLQDPDHVHQFLDYSWRVSEYFKEPVRLFRALHIVGLPKLIVRETTFVPDAVQQEEWLRQARRKWHLMEQMRIDPGQVFRNENGCKPYGERYPCPMWTACWTCHGDQEAMARFYTRKER